MSRLSAGICRHNVRRIGQFVALWWRIDAGSAQCCADGDNGAVRPRLTACQLRQGQIILPFMKCVDIIVRRHVRTIGRLAIAGSVVLGLGAGAGIAQERDVIRPPERRIPAPAAPKALAMVVAPAVPAPLAPVLTADAALVAPGNTPVPLIDASMITVRPPVRSGHVPRTRWQHMPGHTLWTRAAISALKDHGSPLVDMVPRDIKEWCPAYGTNDDAQRRAFWVGYMSTLAKYESTYKPWAVGGGGKWYGLLQILPATARGYKCNVGTGEALKNGAANLSCATRIMAHTVKRDGVIHGYDGKWRGVSADWGPMRNPAKRRDMASWLKRQSYCQPRNATRPRARP